MLRNRFWLALAASALTFTVAAGPAAHPDMQDFRLEADLLKRDFAKAPPTPEEVGDADSFGRNVIWDGLLQSGTVTLAGDCTPLPGDPPPGPDDRCVTLNAAPAITTFDLPDIGRIELPAKASKSLLCHWLSPINFYQFNNTTAATQFNAFIRLTPYIVVESEVFLDPALIDPGTGLPLGGQLLTGFSASYGDTRTLEAGERASLRHSESRTCIAGFLSKRNLIEGYGLSEAQAKEVFKRKMTLRFGLRGSTALISDAFLIYGLRVMGD